MKKYVHSFINTHFSTFRSKLTAAFIFTSMIPLLFSITIALVIINTHLEKESQHHLHSNSDLRVQQMENFLNQIIFTQDSLSSNFQTTLTLDNMSKEISSLSLSRFESLRTSITSLEYIYNFQRIRIYSDYFPFTNGDNFHFFPLRTLDSATLQQVQTESFSISQLKYLSPTAESPFISFHRTLRNLHGDIIAIYFIDICLDDITKRILPQNSSDISAAIILPDSRILYKSSDTIHYPKYYDFFEQIYSSGTNYQILKKSRYTNWIYLFELSPTSYISVNHALLSGYLLIFSFTVLLCVITIIIFSNMLSKRIRCLSNSLNNIPEESFISSKTNPLDALINPLHIGDEIDDIIIAFQNIFQRNTQLNMAVRNRELEIEKSRFTILQEQINPHFLYNTLDTILICMLMDQNNTACSLIRSLSHFYRISLSKGKDILPLSQELEMIQSYLEIECVGYDGKIQWDINCENHFSQFAIPKFTLQPIVENSILHGNFTVSGKVLHIKIDVTYTDSLQITISDNGPGIPFERLKEINHTLSSKALNTSTSYGLQNCCQRIRLYFGSTYGIHIQSTTRGTQTIVTLPAVSTDIIS